MSTKNIFLLSAILLLFSSEIFGQVQDPEEIKVWQMSGLIVNRQSEDRSPVPFARINVNRSRRGMLCNGDGFYSLPVVETDTLFFSALGFKEGFLVVADYLKAYQGDKSSPYLYAIHYLDEDTIMLPDVKIYSYDNASKLKTAMLAMRSDQYARDMIAQGNMDPETLDNFIEKMDIDAGERALVARQLYYQRYQSENVAPVMPLFDPVAVYKLLKHINNKAKKEKDDGLNYWED